MPVYMHMTYCIVCSHNVHMYMLYIIYYDHDIAFLSIVLYPTPFQFNGVELPCNTILHAEPADMDYKNRNTNPSSNTGAQVAVEAEIVAKRQSDKVQSKEEEEEEGEQEDDADLVDFFASLE